MHECIASWLLCTCFFLANSHLPQNCNSQYTYGHWWLEIVHDSIFKGKYSNGMLIVNKKS